MTIKYNNVFIEDAYTICGNYENDGPLSKYFDKKYALEALKNNFKCIDGDYVDNPDRKKNIKKWLIDNYILDKEDINENVDNIENKN